MGNRCLLERKKVNYRPNTKKKNNIKNNLVKVETNKFAFEGERTTSLLQKKNLGYGVKFCRYPLGRIHFD